MPTLDWMISEVATLHEDMLKLPEQYDSAILGVTSSNYPVIAYSVQKIIDLLMEEGQMDYEDAWEFFEYNIEGAFLGSGTPIYIDTAITEEYDDACTEKCEHPDSGC